MKRIALFLMTNLAVILVASVVLRLLGVDRYLTQNGLNYEALLIFSVVFGFAGSFVSLLISKKIALWTTKAQIITEPGSAAESWLLSTVARQARQAGIGTPDVAVYQSPEPNAFATGWNRNSALVAVSTGLMQQMSQDEVEAVLGHEVSHVANGDMVTMALIQGVLNTFVIFISRVVGYFIDKAVFRNERGIGIGYYLTVFALEVVFGILASMIAAWYSRQREFRADAGGAHLADRRKMIAALERLGGVGEKSRLPDQMAAFGIAGGASKWFSTHPPIAERIAALQGAGSIER